MKLAFVLATSLLVSSVAYAHDVDPNGFEKEHFMSSMSRAEVNTARTTKQPFYGMKIDDQGRLITPPSVKTRAQVAAETREAARLGLLKYTVLGPVQATVEQEQMIKLAGLRAINYSAAIE